VSFSADGRRLASASADGTVRIWDAATGAALAVLPHGLPVGSAAFSPNGTLIASGSGYAELKDGFVHLWNTSTRQELLRLGGHWGGVNSVAFSPDGTRLASGGWDTTVRIWDVATGEELLVLRGHEHPIASVAFSPDGALLASSARDEPLVRLWDTVPYRLRYAQQQAAPAGRQTDADGPDSSPE
jgi:WD40 repeat protein